MMQQLILPVKNNSAPMYLNNIYSSLIRSTSVMTTDVEIERERKKTAVAFG
jgi:hypothetical protein